MVKGRRRVPWPPTRSTASVTPTLCHKPGDYRGLVNSAVWRVLEGRAKARPADPVLTFVDGSGQRTELSAKTLANNAAKAANALVDEAFIESGSNIAFRVPWHWQRAVWSLAAWLVDATVVPNGDPADCDLVIAGPEESALITGARDLWVVSLHPFGLPNPSVPAGASDAATIARMQPDSFMPQDAEPLTPALDLSRLHVNPAQEDELPAGATQDELLAAATGIGSRFGLVAGGRGLVVGEPEGAATAWLIASLVALACDASIVIATGEVDASAVAAQESARLLR